jgi:hypothetical protein
VHQAERNVVINHGSVEHRGVDDQPNNGPARRASPPPTPEATATTPVVPNPTQSNTGVSTTVTQDGWNSSPPNKTVPSASPPNQQ